MLEKLSNNLLVKIAILFDEFHYKNKIYITNLNNNDEYIKKTDKNYGIVLV